MTHHNDSTPQAPSEPVQRYAIRTHRVLICDLVGLRFDQAGLPDAREVKHYIEARGGVFHHGSLDDHVGLQPGLIHFFYNPELSTAEDLRREARDGRYDAVIAAATHLPADVEFGLGGVRIGAGTGNMASRSWGGGDGQSGPAVLMNTPGVNSRATAQAAIKALLQVRPDIAFAEMHERAISGRFDTGRHLKDFPATKLEGQTMAVAGYGHIGREFAALARAFGMRVKIYARETHRERIEGDGYIYAPRLQDAVEGADAFSLHVGLGPRDAATQRFANQQLVGRDLLKRLNANAVLINFDRGELLDVQALDEAMAKGRVGFAAIDADIFVDETTGDISGPLAPYIPLNSKYPGRLLLLPHAAADTDHPSRVAGAKQAVDQIFDLINAAAVSNLKGQLPPGLVVRRAQTSSGAPLSLDRLLAVSEDAQQRSELGQVTALLADFWRQIDRAENASARQAIVRAEGERMSRVCQRLTNLLEAAGLGPPVKQRG